MRPHSLHRDWIMSSPPDRSSQVSSLGYRQYNSLVASGNRATRHRFQDKKICHVPPLAPLKRIVCEACQQRDLTALIRRATGRECALEAAAVQRTAPKNTDRSPIGWRAFSLRHKRLPWQQIYDDNVPRCSVFFHAPKVPKRVPSPAMAACAPEASSSVALEANLP
jgi:hypothetical protein